MIIQTETVRDLEIKLENAKKLEHDNYIKSQIEQNSKWIGKCFSTHIFQRIPKSRKEITLRKITKVYWENNRLMYEGKNITFRLHKPCKLFLVEIIDTCSDIPYPSWVGSFNHEINEQLFDQILVETTAHAETYFDKIRGLFKQNHYISIGDQSDEDNKIKWLKDATFIDLPTEGFNSVKDILSWYNHPFLYGYNKLLYTRESIEIVKKIADSISENMHSWGGSIYERDSPRVQTLIEFYNKYKL